MTVHRLTLLPTGPGRGRLIVAEAVLAPTATALQTSAGPRGEPHEGLVLWIGRTVGADTVVLAAASPAAEHGYGHVHVSEESVATTARAARALGLGIVAQVHSHPGDDTRHSDGDDQLVLMPYEGMFSLVVAQYGQGSLDPGQGAGLHQHQDGHWVALTAPDTYRIVPCLLIPEATP